MPEPDFLRTTRTFYDAVATDRADHFRDAPAAKPLDRAVLAGFAELVRAADAGPVADEGSMLALDLPDGALGGIVAWYSITGGGSRSASPRYCAGPDRPSTPSCCASPTRARRPPSRPV
ncbi:hypothetical protein [Streptomyces inhibens]|uniref:hypothetical protein n=1 Tax=Streptomyces inhibens TaxID=2293571 RepID=UPI003159E22E